MADLKDSGFWHPVLEVAKYLGPEEDVRAGHLDPFEVVTIDGNLLLNAGITRIWNLVAGAGGTAFNAANCRLGVGDSTTAAAATQTDLQAATNKYYKLCDSVTVSGQNLVIVATFGTAVANFAWEEWGIDNGTASNTTPVAPMLNRKVATVGTKQNTMTWVATATITLS